MCIGGSVDPGPARTQVDINKDTDNAHINPVSKTTKPQWKIDQENAATVKANEQLQVPEGTVTTQSERYG